MGQTVAEAGALLRCLRMGTGLPAAAVAAWRSLPALSEAYEHVVAPMLDDTLTDPAERARIAVSLRATSVKYGIAVLGYARLAGRAPQLDVAVLAGAVTRLYDDLIDTDCDPAADARLGELLGNRPFVAATEAELLLGRLVYDIERRLRHPPDASVFTALVSLHEYQTLSRRQRDPDVPLDVLEKITRGKGSAANLVLCGLVTPRLDLAERELAVELGETLQCLDDYMDVELDRGNGVTTLPSLGVVTLPDIAGRLRSLRPRLAACYGRRAAGPYCGMLYFLLVKSWVGRRLPLLGRLAAGPARRSSVLAFLARGQDALPAARPARTPAEAAPAREAG
ncbi:hypothetical protein [Streptomyces sp. CA-111067]|uniref:hypothetical protein n=1 Tax=Streptomyces sp. CA-111067 TaxID=3240046 RepID=UPI003D9889A2